MTRDGLITAEYVRNSLNADINVLKDIDNEILSHARDGFNVMDYHIHGELHAEMCASSLRERGFDVLISTSENIGYPCKIEISWYKPTI